MFNNNVEPLENLIDQFAQFPGIGRKSAVRMAYQVMSMPPKQAMELAKAIEHAKSDLHRCRICQDYTTGDVCKICASQKRDRSIICVVEGPRDIKSIERTHEYNGLYHVLHGLISPMDGIGADQLCIKELLARLNDTVKEVIMATSPTVEGEATAMYIAKLIKPLGIKTTRLAYGLPVGSSLEYADETTLYRAMAGRGVRVSSKPTPAAARNLPPSISRLRGQSAVSMTGWMSSSAQARRAVVTMSQSFSLPKLYTPPGSSMAWASRSTASRT